MSRVFTFARDEVAANHMNVSVEDYTITYMSKDMDILPESEMVSRLLEDADSDWHYPDAQEVDSAVNESIITMALPEGQMFVGLSPLNKDGTRVEYDPDNPHMGMVWGVVNFLQKSS